MNIGYNGSIIGARRIHQIEASKGYNIPWAIFLEIGEESFCRNTSRYHELIEQGERMGIYSWFLISQNQVQDCLNLAAAHPNSAFMLFCSAGEITQALIDCAAELDHLMLVVLMDEDAFTVCPLLREAGLLYSLYTTYDASDLSKIESGDYFYDMEQLHPAFSIFIPKQGCPENVQEHAYIAIHTAWMAQTHATILWEMYRDNLAVDRMLSEDGYLAGIDSHGVFYGISANDGPKAYGPIDLPLEELFALGFPKKQDGLQ